jgi:pilus assembly protein Flp/PilA
MRKGMRVCEGIEFMRALRRRGVDRDEGVTALEYAIIAGLVALVIVGGVEQIGTAVNGIFDDVQQFFADAL